ncbi:MAG: penicillin-binding protein 2 [Flammeovirgaceae bacterium TMED32]|nr:MAG: penicillin-binding protein 2 [Flammeovirgaceae bacterium TMED32]
MRTSRDKKSRESITRRSLLLGGAKIGLFSLLAGRLYYLQVTESEKYKTLSENNQFNMELLPPVRGRILDRKGIPLALNKDNFRIEIIAEQTKDIIGTLKKLGKIIEIDDVNMRRILKEMRSKRGFVPVSVVDNLKWDAIASVAINTPYLPGVRIDVGRSRFYPYGENAVHVTGYVSAVSETEQTGDPLLELPDFRIGKSGIEKSLDRRMRGFAQQRQVEVNALGRIVRRLPGKDQKIGNDVDLTIDVRVQQFVSQRLAMGNSNPVPVDDPRVIMALKEGERLPLGVDPASGTVNLNKYGKLASPESGAAVVMDAFSGEVLAITSTPGFNPNRFTHGLTARDWERLLANPFSPMTNKAIAGQYSPGSTFKMIVCLAALEAGIWHEKNRVECKGHIDLGGSRFHCWKKHGHGSIEMSQAIEQSCDVYLYEIAKSLGIKKIAAMARRFGFGAKSNIELPGERAGLVPSSNWKKLALGQKWHQGETLITSIGQGFILCTPLQLARMTAGLVNGGSLVTPRLLKSTIQTNLDISPLNLNPKHLRVVLDGMNKVTNGSRGTARGVSRPSSSFRFGGKTGSVQVKRISLDDRRVGNVKNKDKPWAERDHAMFVGYAPLNSPRYVVSVVVEHGGGGSTMAAPIARDILKKTIELDPVAL